MKVLLSAGLFAVGVSGAFAIESGGDDWILVGCDLRNEACNCEPYTPDCVRAPKM